MPSKHRNAARRWKSPLMSTWGAVLVLALLWVLIPEGTSAGEEPVPIESVPVAPSPTPPLAEQLLAPVPSQFNWMRREVRSNPLLEALLQLTERPPQLLMSVSLTEEYSDNFFLSERNQEEEFRTGIDIGTIYRLEGGEASFRWPTLSDSTMKCAPTRLIFPLSISPSTPDINSHACLSA